MNIIGQKFGRLTVLEFSHYKDYGYQKYPYYKCICECGKNNTVRRSTLVAGQTKSCGCLQSENMIKQGKISHIKNTLEGNEAAKRILYKNYQANAKKHKRKFEIEYKEFIEFTSKNCHYCNALPGNLKKTRKAGATQKDFYLYNGLDRVNTNQDYTPDNVVPCCIDCNKAKMEMTTQEFLNLIKRIYEFKKL